MMRRRYPLYHPLTDRQINQLREREREREEEKERKKEREREVTMVDFF